jgi:methyl-accepting chemotaxis protein
MQAAVQRMINDADLLARAAVEGKLATRADASKHQGDFQKVVTGRQRTSLPRRGHPAGHHPLNVTARYVDDIIEGRHPAGHHRHQLQRRLQRSPRESSRPTSTTWSG